MTRGKRFVQSTGCFIFHCLPIVLTLCTTLEAEQPGPFYFDVKDVNAPADNVPVIAPWRIVQLDPEYGGQWVLAADLAADLPPRLASEDAGAGVEILSCENVNNDDVHYTSTAVAQKLDGSILWRWGDPNIGRKNWHHDVACQIHDWDGDGKNEVVLCTKGSLVELDGATGAERRRFAIADDATDCLVFCNLAGSNRPSDVLVKDRYHRIWAYDCKGALLWSVTDPGGYRTAHQPRPIDLDGDGRDEIMAGYAMLNSDGSLRWVFKSEKVDQARGHLDCARVYRKGARPEEFKLILTCCGANNIAMIDGNGKALWEVAGRHFESIDVGRVLPDAPRRPDSRRKKRGQGGPQIVVDIDHQPLGDSPIWVLDESGSLLGQIVADYSRHHCLLDWTGDGIDEILVAHNGAIYNHRGRRIGAFATPGDQPTGNAERSMLIGDITGDGVPDVMIATPQRLYIYKNAKGKKPDTPAALGTEFNFTLY
jgi:hypothetical protein